MAKKIDYYTAETNKTLFLEWIDELDLKAQVIVDRFIQRVAQGGAKKSIKNLKRWGTRNKNTLWAGFKNLLWRRRWPSHSSSYRWQQRFSEKRH